jgi:hypothetical protein
MEKLYGRRDFIKKASLSTVGGIISLASPLPLFASSFQDKHYDFSKDSEQTLMARLLCGEASGTIASRDKREAVVIGYTVTNRVKDGIKWNGETLKEVMLKKVPMEKNGKIVRDQDGDIVYVHQYSCFNSWDSNLKKIKNPEKYYSAEVRKHAYSLAGIVLKNELPFLDDGQDHYHTKNTNPPWSKSPKMKRIWEEALFNHKFYKYITA